eukprot:scaffold27928_cov115-Isochrysis_galbana.AAC.1
MWRCCGKRAAGQATRISPTPLVRGSHRSVGMCVVRLGDAKLKAGELQELSHIAHGGLRGLIRGGPLVKVEDHQLPLRHHAKPQAQVARVPVNRTIGARGGVRMGGLRVRPSVRGASVALATRGGTGEGKGCCVPAFAHEGVDVAPRLVHLCRVLIHHREGTVGRAARAHRAGDVVDDRLERRGVVAQLLLHLVVDALCQVAHHRPIHHLVQVLGVGPRHRVAQREQQPHLRHVLEYVGGAGEAEEVAGRRLSRHLRGAPWREGIAGGGGCGGLLLRAGRPAGLRAGQLAIRPLVVWRADLRSSRCPVQD